MTVYERLQVLLDSHPSSAPQSRHFDEILRILFTPDEAVLALSMNFSPRSADSIAAKAEIPTNEAEALLESMAEKVIIFSREKDGHKEYGLIPTIPGLFEFPFMRGGGTESLERLGELWHAYHREALGKAFAGSTTPLARVIPVEKALDTEIQVHPYEEVAMLIEKAEYIALAQCACRVSVGKCDAPRDTCLIFGAPARFLVEKGYARKITRAKALKVLDRSERAGLVHTSNNSADRAGFICNCCSCCCTLLRGLTELDLPNAIGRSGFEALVDPEKCNGCGICSDERCPVGAAVIEEETALVDGERCIGCGLCVSTCPTEAISLVRRSRQPDVPATMQEMGMAVLSEKGKLEAFMNVMNT